MATKKELLAQLDKAGVTGYSMDNTKAELEEAAAGADEPAVEYSSLLERDTTEPDNIQRPIVTPADVIDDRSNGGRVVAIQAALEYSGQHCQVDGQYGRQTRIAVQKHQETHGLPVTGIVDRATWLSIAEYVVTD